MSKKQEQTRTNVKNHILSIKIKSTDNLFESNYVSNKYSWCNKLQNGILFIHRKTKIFMKIIITQLTTQIIIIKITHQCLT